MSSVRGVSSWQDAYIFCLQPNFQDDLWLFMIFAAIQVSLAGLKLTSFFINRWARGSKVGSGDDDEDNVGDDGASGGISIMGVLTLIAGALILTAYCEDEPDEKTFNIFKAGVYLNTFLFAVALIFICGLVAAFVIDILTRRRGRSITFRMFLGGTIVLSIAAGFFGATGLMGLKYLQNECREEIDIYFENPSSYLQTYKDYAAEDLYATTTKPTKELLFARRKTLIGEPYTFTVGENQENPVYVTSIIYKNNALKSDILNMKVSTATYTYNNDNEFIGVNVVPTTENCFDLVGEYFDEVDGLMSCPIKYYSPTDDYREYEESSKKIVRKDGCAYNEEQLTCDSNSTAFPLCCSQFSSEYTKGKDCYCINALKDASCEFYSKCEYDLATLDISVQEQRVFYCDDQSNNGNVWCDEATVDKGDWTWENECESDKDNKDDLLDCCKPLSGSFTHKVKQYGVADSKEIDMTPNACKAAVVKECMSAKEYNDGCCDKNNHHKECKFCFDGPADATSASELAHSGSCGYASCITEQNLKDKKECCLKTQTTFGFIFADGTTCHAAINYDECTDNKSLGCQTTKDGCNANKDCFPNCCKGLKFDFSTDKTIKSSLDSDCFKTAPEFLDTLRDYDHQIGQYIYHHSGSDASRKSCKTESGIIDPKCCNPSGYPGLQSDDPCYCHKDSNKGKNACTKVHHSQCEPGNDAYPQCCFDIGNFFGSGSFCECRLSQDPEKEESTCNDVETESEPFDFIGLCPNPCAGGKALISDGSLICEKPVFDPLS